MTDPQDKNKRPRTLKNLTLFDPDAPTFQLFHTCELLAQIPEEATETNKSPLMADSGLGRDRRKVRSQK